MHKLLPIVTACLLLGTAGIARASSIEGRIASLVVRASDGLHIVTVEGQPSIRPACSANFTYYMIKGEHSDIGKSQMAMLLSAYMSGKSVVIVGAETCTRWPDGDIESVTLR